MRLDRDGRERSGFQRLFDELVADRLWFAADSYDGADEAFPPSLVCGKG